MKYHDIYQYLRDNYTFVLDNSNILDRNTLFLIKVASYCLDDKIVQNRSLNETKGYFICHKNNHIVNEDILMLLAKYQLDNEVTTVTTPCGSITAFNNSFDNSNEFGVKVRSKEVINTQEYKDVLAIVKDWQTDNYSRNAITTTLGGYSLVHHMYNTEKYENKFVKKAKLNKKEFDQFVMLPSGLKFAWLLRELKWEPDNKLVLFDVSSFPIAFAKEMILSWDGSYPLHDWAMDHPIAKSILVASGQINEGTRPGAGPKEWDNMWEQEIKKWGGVENIVDSMAKLKQAEVNGDIAWCTVNIAHDVIGQELIFSSLENKPTVLWISNIFDSSPIGAINATRVRNVFMIESRLGLIQKWYRNLKSLMPGKSLVIGSIPPTNTKSGPILDIDNKKIEFLSGEFLE